MAQLECWAMFLAAPARAACDLAAALGCQWGQTRGLQCDADGRTSVAGVFAARDISRDLLLAAVAAAQGTVPRLPPKKMAQ